MSFRFSTADATVEAGVRRIAAEQVAAALAALGGAGSPLAGRIHSARKAVKKLRGLVRLVRPVFDDYAAENDALREAGRHLSGPREAEVARATLAGLIETAGISKAEAKAVSARFNEGHADAHDDEALAVSVAAFRASFEALARRAGHWSLAASGFDAVAPGLEATWAKARRAMKQARHEGEAEAIHTWRKRVKDHWYQARLLEPIWPEMMAPHVAAADDLGETLGLYNDLSEIVRHLSAADGDAAADRLVAEARRRQGELLATAAPLSRRLLAGPPEALSARWRVWWKVWRG